MSVYFTKNKHERENFKVDSTSPVYIPAGVVTANDISCLKAWFEITNCTAGINAGNPGLAIFQYSPDDGTSWIDMPGLVGGEFDGDGVDFQLTISGNTGVFPPVIRYKLTAPVGESYTVKAIRRIHTLPGIFYAPPSSSGGAVPVGFGSVTAAPRSASMTGSTDVLPAPSATGYSYVTSTAFTKSVANDGRALDVNLASSVSLVSQMRFTRDGTSITPVLDTGTPANNRPLPTVQVAGDSAAPVAMGSGADGATVQRATLSTRHEASATPVSTRLSDGTNFIDTLPVFTKNTLVTVAYDTIVPDLSGSTTDVYVYKIGGTGGATVATLTITYTTSSKAVIASVVRT